MKGSADCRYQQNRLLASYAVATEAADANAVTTGKVSVYAFSIQFVRNRRCTPTPVRGQEQRFCFSRYIGQFTPKITNFFMKNQYLQDESIPKIFNLFLSTKSLVQSLPAAGFRHFGGAYSLRNAMLT